MRRLAVIASHPIQYYAPWFKYISDHTSLELKVFYLWDFGTKTKKDISFNEKIKWDIDLLDGYEYDFVENISKNAGTHHFWGLINPKLNHAVQKFSPDVILLMNYNYWSTLNFIRQSSFPLIFRGDSHNLVLKRGFKKRLRQTYISFVFRKFKACLYVGKANLHYLKENGLKNEQLFFSPHCIDNDRFTQNEHSLMVEAKQWKNELAIPDHHQVIMFAGKFEEKKRPLDLLNAFMQAKLKDVSLLFVGSGPLRNDLRMLAQKGEYIYFAPFQNQSIMPRVLSAADLLVLPSYGNRETWGLIINEAMSLGKAVVVSDHVGCHLDLVCPHENGLIFSAGNVFNLSQHLREALSDINRLDKWGVESKKIIKRYCYQEATKGLLGAIDFIIPNEVLCESR